MADEQENIKIVIEIVDKFSKPLVDLKKQLEQISDKGSGPKNLSQNFNTLRESMMGVARTVQSFVMPSLKVLGLGFAGVAASIAGAVASLKGFATSVADLSRLSRETGLTIDRMRELEAAGRRVGISAQEMRHGFRAFSDEMDKMRVGVSTAATEMRQRGLGFVVEGLKARAGDLNKQLEYALSITDRISNPRHRREVMRLIGLPENFATLTGKEREAAIAEFKKTAGAVTKEAEEASKKFDENMQRLADSMEGIVSKLVESGALDSLADSLKVVAENLALLIKYLGLAKKAADENKDSARSSVLKRPEPGQLTIWEQLFGTNNPIWGPGQYGGGTTGPGKKMSFMPGGGGDGGSGGEVIDTLKKGVSEGVQDAFKKMMLGDSGSNVPGAGGGMPNVVRASLGGSRGYRGGGAADGGGGGGDPGPMGQLAGLDRSVFAAELAAKPWLKEKILGIAAGENKEPRANLAVIESMMNRAAVRGTSLEQAAKLYGEGKGGYYAGYDPGSLRRPKIRDMIEGNLKRALEGSNVSNYATDNASQGLAERNKRTGRFRLQSEYGGESFFSPGTAGGKGGPASRERYEQWRRSIPMPPARPSDAPVPPAVPRNRMMEASAASNQYAKVQGEAMVRIDLNGFPRGTKTSASSSGIFSEVELHRGNTVPLASESA